MAAGSLKEVIEQAKKVLGDKAKIPDPKDDPKKLKDDFEKAFDKLDVARGNVESELLGVENAISAYKNGQKQNAAVYQRADFSLNEKSKDDAKKIKLAQKLFSDYFATAQSAADKEMKALDELDKHVIQLSKYKPSLT
jgi:hypothetical protein